MGPDNERQSDSGGSAMSPEPVFITERECERCRDNSERTFAAINKNIDLIAAARAQDSTRIGQIDTKVDLVAADVRAIKEGLAERRKESSTIVRLLIKNLPWILMALGLGGGVAYKSTTSTDDIKQMAVELAEELEKRD